MAAPTMKFSASHAKDTVYADGGLRSCFTYRDLGISDATGGKVMAASAGTSTTSSSRCTTC
jgi:hypothetical protein